ncbi:MAG: penicillin-binding protein activator [Thermodesulfobacteriota bacterium]
MNLALKKALRLLLPAALLLGLVLAVGACGPTPVPPPTPPEAGRTPEARLQAEIEQLISVGQERLSRRRFLLAKDAFQAALLKGPGAEQEVRIRLGLAKSLAGAGLRDQAVEVLRQMPPSGGSPDVRVEAGLLRAELDYKLERSAQVESYLKMFLAQPPRPLRSQERLQALKTLQASQVRMAKWGQATETVLEIIATEGQVTPNLELQLGQVASRATVRELEQLLGRPRPPAVNGALLLALARAQMREGRLDEAAATLSQAQGLPVSPGLQYQIKALGEELNQARLVNPSAVGVILPLSGEYAAYGRQVLAAVELGLGLFSISQGNNPTLYIEDSKSQPAAAAAAVARLVDERKAMAIIGPMGAATSLAAARQAQAKEAPLITLSQVEGITKAGSFVFQNSLTPDQQIRALLQETVNLRGKRRLAVIAPDNAYGKGFMQLFLRLAPQYGAQVVLMESYPLETKDFASLVKRIAGLPPRHFRPGAPDAPKPHYNFDALFMPDGPERAAMLLPQLYFFDLGHLTVMGTSLWFSPELLRQASRFMGNVVIPVSFDPASPRPEVRAFVRDYQAAVGRTPGLLEAQAYDSALVLRRLLAVSQPPRTRSAMRQALLGLQGLAGVCGLIRMDAERHLTQGLTIYTVGKNGRFRPVQESDRRAPATPPPPASEGSPTPTSQPRPQAFPEQRTPAAPSGAVYPQESGTAPAR